MARYPGRTLLLIICLALGWSHSAPAASLTLATALNRAARNHPRILQMQQQLAGRKEQLRAAKGDRLPQVQLQGRYQRLQDAPYENFNGLQVRVNDQTIAHYQLTLIQPLFSGFALQARQQLAKTGVDMASSDLLLTRRAIQLQTTLTYLELMKQGEMLKVADETLAQLQNHLHDAQAFFQQGMIPANDLLKAEVALAEAKQSRQQILSQQRLTASRLALQLDLPLETEFQLASVTLAEPPTSELKSLISKALTQRSEIVTARAAIKAAETRTKLAQSNYYPRLNLVGSYQRDGNNLAASDNSYRNPDNASIGLQLDWTLFAGGANRARSAVARHQIGEQRAALRQLENDIRLEVESALLDLKLARTNRQTAKTALQQARENQKLSELQYRENLLATSDLLDARKLLTRAETNLQTALFDELQAQARLTIALGEDLAPKGGTP